MNPYFEQPGVWHGFHMHLLSEMTYALTPHVVPSHFVSMEFHDYLDYDTGPVADTPTVVHAAESSGPITARIPRPIKRTHRWLAIRNTRTREVVTVVEVMTPATKSGAALSHYLRKRRRILRSATHLVEIDLLRGGPRMPVGGVRPSDYRVMVSRQPDRPTVQVWRIGLRDLLPLIPIPVRTGEPDLRLELKPVIDAVYDRGGYQHLLYDFPPDPPLSPR
jgi:hypothetical protein